MSDSEKQSLEKLFTKKFNILTTSVMGVLVIFVALFITFMVNSSNKNGIQDTRLDNISKVQEETVRQINEIAKAVNILTTEKEVKQTEYNNLLQVITETNQKAQKIEWAVLTNDKSIITRSANKTKLNTND